VRLEKLRRLIVPIFLLFAIAALPATASAQRRGFGGRGPRVIVRGGFYGPVFFDGYWGGYPYYGYPYGYGYARYDFTASIRLEVTPKNAEVFVDGFRAGTVDDFDGFFQRLHVRPGEHELVLYADGFRAVKQAVTLNPGSDQKIQFAMTKLGAGEQPDPRPQPREMPPPDQQGRGMPPQPGFGPRGGGPGRMGPGGPPMPPPNAGRGPAQPGQYGSVSIRVQPADAEVIIDGDRWTAPSGPGQDRLVVQLAGGRHHIEIQKDGFDRYVTDVDVRAGDTLPLNVSLLRR
jgi:hypothetical protein